MFVLALSPTFKATVRFGLPGADGKPQRHEFTAVLRRQTRAEAEAMATKATVEDWTDRQLAAALLAGWGPDLTDGNQLPLPFTPDNLDAVLDVPNVAAAILRAYGQAHEDAALGN